LHIQAKKLGFEIRFIITNSGGKRFVMH